MKEIEIFNPEKYYQVVYGAARKDFALDDEAKSTWRKSCIGSLN